MAAAWNCISCRAAVLVTSFVVCGSSRDTEHFSAPVFTITDILCVDMSKYTHIQHFPFQYEIMIITSRGCIRIFVVAAVDERNVPFFAAGDPLLQMSFNSFACLTHPLAWLPPVLAKRRPCQAVDIT